LKLPLALAALAFALAALGLTVVRKNAKKVATIAVAMVVFFQAARVALIRFDGYLGSYPLAQTLEKSPPGQLIEADAYYAFSSVFFYTNRQALLWNGRRDNLEYGSYAPTAPKVFISDPDFRALWLSNDRYYLLADHEDLPYIHELVGASSVHVVTESGGKYLLANTGS